MKIVKNEDAVSPVIGVILMVAITVILAAVIAAFVFNIGGSQVKTPVASLTISSVSNPTGNITITHSGGDSIDLATVKVIIDGNSTSHNIIALLNTSASQYFSVGDKLIITEAGTVNAYLNNERIANLGASTGNFSVTTGQIKVTLIDTRSSQQIALIAGNVN
jgi:flagellin-like protein